LGIFENNSARKMLENQMKKEKRLPPGQSATLKWPVLHYADVPKFDAAAWEFPHGPGGDALSSTGKFAELPRVK
jgi:hypothetical protein